MIDIKIYDISMFISAVFLMYGRDDDELLEARIEIMNYYIKNVEDKKLKGIAYYNLGNSLKGNNNLRKAFLNYMKLQFGK